MRKIAILLNLMMLLCPLAGCLSRDDGDSPSSAGVLLS